MNINGPDPSAREVLLEVARRMREIDDAPEPPAWKTWEVLERRELKTYGPRYSPAVWFGGGRPIPERHRVRYLRALHELAAGGLLAILGWAAILGVGLRIEGDVQILQRLPFQFRPAPGQGLGKGMATGAGCLLAVEDRKSVV